MKARDEFDSRACGSQGGGRVNASKTRDNKETLFFAD